MDLERMLLELERGFWTDGAAFYRERLTAEAVMAFPGVGIMKREAVLAAIEAAPRWSDVTIEEVEVVPLSFGSVAIVYRVRARRPVDEAEYAAVCTSAYVERYGTWLLATHQQTPTGTDGVGEETRG